MRMASFFSGIGGFDLGFQRAGAEIVFQCEIDPFCNRVLRRHWPTVRRTVDIRKIDDVRDLPQADVWCAGFPCQDVSLALRTARPGLRGGRSGLFYPFANLVRQASPQVVVLENVAGLLTSHHGLDFSTILRELQGCGYAVGWRVLNTQFFGLPQYRRRLYVVAWRGSPQDVAAVLFDKEQAGSHTLVSRQETLAPLKVGVGDESIGPVVQKVAYCLAATAGRHTGNDWSRTYVAYPDAARRITPEEAERMQGFPTGWTRLDVAVDAARTSDSARYAALGNAVSVAVTEWLGGRIRSAMTPGLVDRFSAKPADGDTQAGRRHGLPPGDHHDSHSPPTASFGGGSPAS
jgi:DNA (cytosine-5)-methyltransferase 1